MAKHNKERPIKVSQAVADGIEHCKKQGYFHYHSDAVYCAYLAGFNEASDWIEANAGFFHQIRRHGYVIHHKSEGRRCLPYRRRQIEAELEESKNDKCKPA